MMSLIFEMFALFIQGNKGKQGHAGVIGYIVSRTILMLCDISVCILVCVFFLCIFIEKIRKH